MPIYQYEAVGPSSKRIQGAIDAESLESAKQKLLKQSLFLVRIKEAAARTTRSILKRHEQLRLTRELSRLLKAGLPLYESLLALEEKYRGQKAQRLLLDLCEQVRGGERFSSALARHGATFDFLFVAMVANAEQTGSLSAALEELSHLIAKQLSVRKQLMNALLYPAFLFGFCLVVLSSLLFYVVPSLQDLFEGRELHPLTTAVFWVSKAARNSKVPLCSAAALLAGGFAILWLRSASREMLRSLVFRLPLLQSILAKAALLRFCRAAASLSEGTVPIVEALSQASSVMRHPVLQKSVEQATKAIGEGKPMDEAFRNQPLIPSLLPRMLGIAKEGGTFSPTLRHLSDIYEDDLERALTLFTSVAQPALLLFLGLIIGFVLLSVLIPLTDVSSFAAN